MQIKCATLCLYQIDRSRKELLFLFVSRLAPSSVLSFDKRKRNKQKIADTFTIFACSCLSVLHIIKLNKSDFQRQIEHVHSVVVSKISNSVGRNDNFLAKAGKLSILPTWLDIFDIRQHYIRFYYISKDQ